MTRVSSKHRIRHETASAWLVKVNRGSHTRVVGIHGNLQAAQIDASELNRNYMTDEYYVEERRDA